MNSQRHHILRRPNLQDLRRLKVYKTICLDKILQPNEFTYVHDSHKGQLFHQYSTRDVNLRGIFLMFGGMIVIAAVVAAVARIPSVRFAGIIFVIFGRGCRRCSTLSSFFLFNYLKEAEKET
jgi:hypothetical protein